MSEPVMAAIVLAAGSSKRFGSKNKLLADFAGRSVIESVCFNVAKCGFDVVVVVVAPEQPTIEHMVHAAGLRAVVNRHPELGMGTSIACGIRQLAHLEPDNLSGVGVFLGDMPSVSEAVVGQLIDCFKGSGCQNIVRPITVLNQSKELGHPVIFPSDFLSELERLDGDAGAKQLIAANQSRLTEVTVIDRGATTDIDYPLDLSDHSSL